jgi:hypothetical protein
MILINCQNTWNAFVGLLYIQFCVTFRIPCFRKLMESRPLKRLQNVRKLFPNFHLGKETGPVY